MDGLVNVGLGETDLLLAFHQGEMDAVISIWGPSMADSSPKMYQLKGVLFKLML